MRILALVPARGGSRRLPGKNIRELGGKPLIVWSIDVAADVTEICDVLVSTDDPAIARVAEAARALVPWLRPAHLATDSAGSVDVALHALDWYERERGSVDGVLLLQPTSPFRTKATVRTGIEKFATSGRKAVVGVSRVHTHPMWAMRIDEGRLVPFMADHGLEMRSQDLPPAYVVNGAFYLIAPSELRALRSFLGRQAIPLVLNDPQEAVDIDTEWDWRLAEFILATSQRPPSTPDGRNA